MFKRPETPDLPTMIFNRVGMGIFVFLMLGMFNYFGTETIHEWAESDDVFVQSYAETLTNDFASCWSDNGEHPPATHVIYRDPAKATDWMIGGQKMTDKGINQEVYGIDAGMVVFKFCVK